MAAFNFIALTHTGIKKKGMIEAASPKEARQLLRDKGLVPLEIYTTQSKEKSKKSLFSASSISRKELALITRQMATLLAAGLPLEEVLAAVSEQAEKSRTRSLLLAVRSKVLEGHALASALRDFPAAFSSLYSATVAAGERSGHLDIVLQRLADFTEQQAHMRQKITHALVYPSIMVCVAVGILGFLLEYVVPKMVGVYSNMGQSLPTVTQILINISVGLKANGIYLIISIIALLFLFKRHMQKNLNFKVNIHSIMLKIPLLGNAIKVINTGRFARTCAILSSAGVPIIEAMKISSNVILNLPIRYAIEDATKRVREGGNIHHALKQTTYFPPMSIHLIASGESSGQLENMLERAANNQDNDITRLIDTLLTLFEPAIILFMGAMVLFIVLAILLPIFQLNEFT